MTLLLHGNGVSRGISIGRVRLLHEIQPRVRRKKIKPTQCRAELRRFRNAVRRAEDELQAAQKQTPRAGTVTAIFDSHIAMLRDPALIEPIENSISEHLFSCEWALAQQRDELLAMFANIEDLYLRQRSTDVEETITRLLKHLDDRRRNTGTQPAPSKFVLVTKNLSPSDLIQQQDVGLIGAITEEGSQLSHTTIVAKNLNIPLLVNVPRAMSLLEETDELIIDGTSGCVLVNPDASAIKTFRARQKDQRLAHRKLAEIKDRRTRSRDNQHAQVFANAASVSEVSQALKAGAEGIGLFRTESLYLNRSELPTETEHLQTYRKLLTRLKGEPLVVRTMDVWSSRRMPGLEQFVPVAQQPALSLRGIRLCLRHPEVFLPQLRALLRAAHYGPIDILLPMVSCVQEVRDLLQLIEQTQQDLKRQRRAFGSEYRIGIMIEVPAAALMAKQLAPLVDFMAIGSNDLAQYTLAMDRDDPLIQPLLDPLSPAILQLVRETVKAGDSAGVPVSLCGEMAGEPNYTRLLLGLGVRQFSMHPSSMLEVKRQIMATDISQVEKVARAMTRASSPQRTHQLLEKINAL